MSDLRISFLPPDPLNPLPHRIAVKQALVRGRCSGCCVCHQSCWTWWSPNPPSGYVPLHGTCVNRLFEQWEAGREKGGGDGVTTTSTVTLTGAYARLARPAAAMVVIPSGVQRPAVLPDGFTPGPFWLPGDTADTPWTVVAETASGRMIYPGDSHARGYETALRLEKLRQTSDSVPVAAVALVDPQGFSETVWGELVAWDQPPRWTSVIRLSDWRRCGQCHDLRWPGTWMELLRLICLTCLAAEEAEDPRPALSEPSRPEGRYVPERFTRQPKPLALPRGFGRRR